MSNISQKITTHRCSSFEILTIGHFVTLSHPNKTDSISPLEGNWLTSLLGELLVCNGPYRFWVKVSDLYVNWSKVAVGLIIHKNDKKS